MKRFVTAAAIAAAAVMGAASAQAADFTGSYAGLTIGGNHYNAEMNDSTGFVGETEDLGLTYGVYGGHTWSLGSGFVGGVELDVANTTAEQSMGTDYSEQNWSFGASAIAGYEVREDLLAYGKLGYVATNFELGSAGVSDDEYLNGLRLGFGGEYALDENWNVRTEYLFTSYDSEGISVGGNAVDFDPTEHSVRMGVGYRF